MMKVGVTSQNFRTITGHAGKTRRFIIYEVDRNQPAQEIKRLDLPKEMSLHETGSSEPHPIDELDILITAGCGDGFRRKMADRGIQLLITEETDPEKAVESLVE